MLYSYEVTATTEDWLQELGTKEMDAGLGYIVRGPETAMPFNPYTAIFNGVPNNGHYVLTGIFEDKSYLIGNPYPSAIDADEFFTHQTLKIIEEICNKTSSAISLPWRNAYPAEIFEDPKNLMLETDLFLFSRRSTVHKTIINTNMVRRDGARWLAGNHLAVDIKGNFLDSQKWHNAYILHIPIRSIDQFTEKLKKGNEAYSELERYRKRKNMGFHWQIDTNLFSGLNFDFYMSKVCYYSENLQENRDVSARKKVRGSLKYFYETY
jgi:hypothetical protein